MRDLNANRKTYHVFNIYNIIILMSSMFWKKNAKHGTEFQHHVKLVANVCEHFMNLPFWFLSHLIL